MITQEPFTTSPDEWRKLCDAGAVAIQFMDTDVTLLRISPQDPNTASGVNRNAGHTFFSGDWFVDQVKHPVWVRGKRDETTLIYSCDRPVDIVIPTVDTVPVPDSFAFSDNLFTADNVTNNGHGNVETSSGNFIDPDLEQSSTSLAGTNGGHWKLTDPDQEGVLLDYSLKNPMWFNASGIVPREGFVERSSTLAVVFYEGGEEVYRTTSGTDEHSFDPVRADQVQLVMTGDAPGGHAQFNYLKLSHTADNTATVT